MLYMNEILDAMETEEPGRHECALLSERALAIEWNHSDEDAAWAHLQVATETESDTLN